MFCYNFIKFKDQIVCFYYFKEEFVTMRIFQGQKYSSSQIKKATFYSSIINWQFMTSYYFPEYSERTCKEEHVQKHISSI